MTASLGNRKRTNMRQQSIEPRSSGERENVDSCDEHSRECRSASSENADVSDSSVQTRHSVQRGRDRDAEDALASYSSATAVLKNKVECGPDACLSAADLPTEISGPANPHRPAEGDGSIWREEGRNQAAAASDVGAFVIDIGDKHQVPSAPHKVMAQTCNVNFAHHHRPSECSIEPHRTVAPAEDKESCGSEPVYLQSYSFNQDNTCFVCATSVGFRVFTCAPLFEFMRREAPVWGEGCYDVAGMLFRTNVFALVSRGDPKKVKLWDDQKRHLIGELRSRQAVKNVCLGREILAMVTEYSIYVYQSEQMRPFNIIHTGSNQRGLCIIAAGREREHWILGCPAVAAGAVRIQTSEGERRSHVFQAHQSALAALSFSSQGTWIATASETGTVIRVFSTLDGQLLHELRRGTHSYAISCIALRADGLFLAVASSSPTVHIFKLDPSESAQNFLTRKQSNAAEGPEAEYKVDECASSSRLPASSPESSIEDAHAERRFKQNSSRSCGSGGIHSVSESDSSQTVSSGIPLQRALTVGKEITSVVYDASREIVHDAIKGVLPRYFSAVRSFAQFHVPTDQQSIDVRARDSQIVGPLCAFAGERSNHLYLLHPNGVFYEFRFDPNYGDDCTLLTATTWFAPRAEFQIQSRFESASLPSELEGGHEGDDWQIVM